MTKVDFCEGGMSPDGYHDIAAQKVDVCAYKEQTPLLEV